MPRPVEQPKATTAGDSTTTTHPAFGMIGASRFTGRAVMYGSDFIHNAGMTIRIYRGELKRDLSHDWFGTYPFDASKAERN